MMNKQIEKNLDLSIIVITHNRQQIIARRLANLIALFELENKISFEIILSDNSTSGKIELPHDLRQKIVIKKTERFLPTAEEHFFHAMQYGRGNYTWVIGDHDAIHQSSIEMLCSLIKNNKYDIFAFNQTAIDENGNLIKSLLTICQGDILKIPFIEFIAKTGIQFTSAGIGKFIFKSKYVKEANYEKFLKASAIYSHVYFLISIFHNKEFCFLNRPLIKGRIKCSNNELNGFHKHAERTGKFLHYPWTLGMFRLFEILVKEKIINYSFIGKILDQNTDQRFVLVIHIAQSLIEQIKINPFLKINERMTEKDYKECILNFSRIMPEESELLGHFTSAWEESKGWKRVFSAKNWKSASNYIWNKQRKCYILQYFVGFERSFAVYDTPWGVYAVTPNNVSELCNFSRIINPSEISFNKKSNLLYFANMQLLKLPFRSEAMFSAPEESFFDFHIECPPKKTRKTKVISKLTKKLVLISKRFLLLCCFIKNFSRN